MPAPVLAVLGRGLVPADTPLLRVDDLGVARGESVFETLRVVGGTAIARDAHLERMRRSAARIAVDLPATEEWERLVDEVLAAWPAETEGMLRLTATKGGDGSDAAPPVRWALLSPVPASMRRQRAEGIAVVLLTLGVPAGLRPDAPWLLGGVKSTSYAMNMAAQRAAVERGADDAVLVSTDGEVLEAPTATAVWWDGRSLVSPPPDEVAVLPGTTAATVLDLARQDGLPVEVRRGTVDELRAAGEVALLSSVRGVAPVVRLDGEPVGDGTPGPVLGGLRDAYERWCGAAAPVPPG